MINRVTIDFSGENMENEIYEMPSISHLNITLKKHVLTKIRGNIYKNVLISNVLNSPKLETTEMSINRYINGTFFIISW